jgi:predicted metal-binding membrane protein
MGGVQAQEYSNYGIRGIFEEKITYSAILTIVSNGMLPWIIMVVAMMFPLLNEPLRHVAFSLRRKNRYIGVFTFLAGYTVAWSAGGVLFLLLSFFLDGVVGAQTQVNYLIKASGFLLAAVLIWHPARPLKMARCGQTMPIRIQGLFLLFDSLFYGLKMGFDCLRMCWAPMAALMLAHHSIILMGIVTVIIIYERYSLSHTSKLPGYALGLIALTMFSIGMWA